MVVSWFFMLFFFFGWEASPSHFQRRGEPRQGLSWRRRGLSQWCTSKIEPTIYVEGWIKHLRGRGGEKFKFSAKKRDDFARYDRALSQLVKGLSLSKKIFSKFFFSFFFSIQSRMVNMPAACSPCLMRGRHACSLVSKPMAWFQSLNYGPLCMQQGFHACGMVSMPAAWSPCLRHGFHACGVLCIPPTWYPCLRHGN